MDIDCNNFEEEYSYEQNKEDIFRMTDEENTNQISYGDTPYIPLSNDTSKPCFKLLESLNIPNEVKQKIEEKIITSGERSSSIKPEIMCALVIVTFFELNLDVDIDAIIRLFDINSSKNKIMQLISKATTKKTILSQQNTSINMVIVNPSDYIIEIFDLYINKVCVMFNNKDYVVNKIKELTIKLEEYYPLLVQEYPRETASAIVYFYLNGNINKCKRQFFNENIFSSLQFINKNNFKKRLKYVESIFNDFSKRFPDAYISFYS
jgi:hypothetical protein